MPVSQYQFGGTNPTIATVATAKAVAVGDIVGMSSGTLVKASDETGIPISPPPKPTLSQSFWACPASRRMPMWPEFLATLQTM